VFQRVNKRMILMRRLSLSVLAMLLSTVCTAVLAATLDEGVAAYQLGDYDAALKIFRPLAEQGNTAAEYNIGQMYRMGRGITRDFAEAAKWYRLAAGQGDALSQYNLGMMYYNAQGVPQSIVLSHMWLTISAMSGADNAVRNRTILAKQMSREQINEAVQLARTCQKQNFKNCD
jgi:TPR repeat protein